MHGFLEEYFIRPMAERTGYNIVNTLVYAAIALACLYAVWRIMKARGYDFSKKEFLYALAAFVLLGSTSRVITDLADAGELAKASGFAEPLRSAYFWLSESRIFDYGFLTITPGIYIVIAVLFFLSIALSEALKMPMFPFYSGLLLWAPALLLLLPFASYWLFFALSVALAAAGALASFFILGFAGERKLSCHEKLAIAGQSLDGSATFVVLDVFSSHAGKSYFEQHVLSSGIGEATALGYFLFFLVKVCLASAIVYLLRKENLGKSDSSFVLLAVGVMGFAPGIRGALRMLCGA